MRGIYAFVAVAVALSPLSIAAASASDAQKNLKAHEIVRENYPSESRRLGEQGAVEFQIITDRRGKLLSCAAVKGSGYPRLDKATCDVMVAHVEIRPPATDGPRPGRRVVTGTMLWALDGGGVTPATAAKVEISARDADAARVICKRTLKVGSSVITKRVCLTKAEWEQAANYAREETERMQQPRGPSRDF